MPETNTSEIARPETLEVIRQYVAWAMRLGLKIEPDVPSQGVVCDPTQKDQWRRATKHGAVTPLGAAILSDRPAVTDIEFAASSALNVGVPYCRGFTDGCAHNEPADDETTRPTRQEYMTGYYDGVKIRMELDGTGPR